MEFNDETSQYRGCPELSQCRQARYCGPRAESDVVRTMPPTFQIYDAIGKKGEELIPGYKLHRDLPRSLHGLWRRDRLVLRDRGVYTFSNRLWTPYLFYNTSEGHPQSAGQYLVQFRPVHPVQGCFHELACLQSPAIWRH